jgi:hypothetical protein
MVDERVRAIADAFEELHALVVSEPALSEFLRPVQELAAVGRRARAGEPVELTVPPESTARIPTRELAERIVAIVKRAPGPLGHEDRATVLTMARLHGNLTRAVVHALFVDYPDLMQT